MFDHDTDTFARRFTGIALVLLLVGIVVGAEPRFWTLDRRAPAQPHRSKTLADIQSRYVHRNAFPDPSTAAHEMTHFINGDIANWANEYGRRRPPLMTAHYCLDGRIAIVKEVDVPLGDVARLVPESLRAMRYKTYLFNGQKPVDAVVEEWACYLNDAAVTLDLGIEGTDIPFSTVEVGIYATCVPWAARSEDPDLQALLAWQWDRAIELSSGCDQSAAHLETFRTSADAESLRAFCRGYFGDDWSVLR